MFCSTLFDCPRVDRARDGIDTILRLCERCFHSWSGLWDTLLYPNDVFKLLGTEGTAVLYAVSQSNPLLLLQFHYTVSSRERLPLTQI